MGRSMIRESFSGKRVLIVLDDAPEFFALFDLRECLHWFSVGSVIIITTKDKNLRSMHDVDSVFRIDPMNANESLELLCWHAFREAKPKEEYHFLAERVVSYCGGLPLALLEVIGSSLFEKTREEWNSVFIKLMTTSMHGILQQLKISFDCLRNEREKNVFLDVCCFFVGKDRAYVTNILSGCGVHAESAIRVLIERSLIQVKKNNKLGIHPLLREMGRKIISEISRKESVKSSRRFIDKDAEYVLTDNIVRNSLYMVLKVLLEVFASSCAKHSFGLLCFFHHRGQKPLRDSL